MNRDSRVSPAVTISVRLRSFRAEHPIVCEALLWAVPALLLGAVLRVLLLSYMPYAYWGADSGSYMKFAHTLLTKGYISLDAKRRFLYPILMVPVSLLPGAPLRWVAWLQHGLGLATLLPVAYLVRRCFVHWRLWIVPVTVLYAGFPLFLWYEHELLGEVVFFATLFWAFAGWVAWVQQGDPGRAQRIFWWFFVPFALFLLTKPSGRFAWPGILVGLAGLCAWRRLTRRQIVALLALMPMTLLVGSKSQSAWVLYTASFPLTQLETPLHAEYKAEIRGLVEKLRTDRGIYYLNDKHANEFLEKNHLQTGYPRWQALKGNDKLKTRLYMDLALEGIRAEPLTFLYFGTQRVAASSNLSAFKLDRFTSARLWEKTAEHYDEAVAKEAGSVRYAFDLPARGPLPAWEDFMARLDPAGDSWRARAVQAWCGWIGGALDFVRYREHPRSARTLGQARITFLGWWMLAAMLLAFLPRHRATLGVWTLVALCSVFGVFIVSVATPRYFGPAWPVLLLLMPVPAEALLRLIRRR